MVEAGPQFNPRKIGGAEFRRSNVFVAWSAKSNRHVHLIGPSQYDAWLLIEFDPDIAWFCERPPIFIDLLPLEGKRRALDFWLKRQSGRQAGVVLYDIRSTRDKALSPDLLKRSIEGSKLTCEVWQAADLQSRATYVRNLKQLQPFVAMEHSSDEEIEVAVVAHLKKVRTASWSELTRLFASRFEGYVNTELARLIHRGLVKADLYEHPLASTTVLRLP
ncbi:MAG: hypothetical protein A2579_05375 [Lysobacterales bacterium RIFOXYD1_FULL_69_11]|uniref:TnsA endonuclease N-terminal domain-containing protein n=1 Tax=Novilysobacter selenitireducens TaxID=2872639 RepID=A0ABS7T5D7_9GAMM|nr:hypothetical protein [Lysobacter selenitireducens]MBZ4039094.1 hypothetical protein [Lysobacter selenitireducens]OHE84873.1 MAG: hypothetical protein A2190_13420 [Xanthomonadales bacterium RIFOXYA1_FULL_69_10]OHE88589.1 MAG: hypothetical protein A2579_05375 [Xanthomonadales bacterium RIFOXYD1_FULL_69_11]